MGHHDKRLQDAISSKMWRDSLLLLSEQEILPEHVRCQLREIARLLDTKPTRIGLRAVRS